MLEPGVAPGAAPPTPGGSVAGGVGVPSSAVGWNGAGGFGGIGCDRDDRLVSMSC